MPLTQEKLIKFNLFQQNEEQITKDQLLKLLEYSSNINSVDQFIKDTPSYPGSTDKISRNELARAIGSTLSIEGIIMDQEEIANSIEKARGNEALNRKEQEAENSRKVYQFIIDIVLNPENKYIYEESVIKNIHKLFTADLNYLSNAPGKYRDNFTPTFGVPRKTGLCKTESEVQDAMSRYAVWLNKDNTGSLESNLPIIKAIMAHYYLTEIYPFGDGNGRTARAIEALILYAHGINNYCFWSLANFWSNHRDEYLHNLAMIRETCNPIEFIIWGLEGYLNEIKRIKESILKKLKQLMLMDYTRYLLNNKNKKKIKINNRIVDFLNVLVNSKPMNIRKFFLQPFVAPLYKNVHAATIRRDLKKMIELQLIIINPNNDSKDEEDKNIIEPNYSILDKVKYRV